MSRPLLEYHSLEDGDLNRLWYEEQDPRARDAFLLRWWLGGDPIAGKDLLSHYHSFIAHRCCERGVVAEKHQLEVFRDAVRTLLAEFPAEPIEAFENVLAPHVDRALGSAVPRLGIGAGVEPARWQAALAAAGKQSAAAADYAARGAAAVAPAEAPDTFAALVALARAACGEQAANHPLVRTPEPPAQQVDESLASAHLTAAEVLAAGEGANGVSAGRAKHLEWCRPCRERSAGALLALRALRQASGAAAPPLPAVAPEFDAELQAAFQEVAPKSPVQRASGRPAASAPAASAGAPAAKAGGCAKSAVLLLAAGAAAAALGSSLAWRAMHALFSAFAES